MRELTWQECELVSGAVDWNRVLDVGQEYGLQGAIAGTVAGFAGGMFVGGVGAGPGAVGGAVSGAVGGFLGGAGVELWRQLRPSPTPKLL